MARSGVSSAWVESPLQLLCAVEYAFATHTDVRIVPRAGGLQLLATAEHLRGLDLPSGVTIEAPRALPALGSGHWIIGDAFSGMARSAISLRMPHRLTIVDDGAATLDLPAVLAGRARLSRSSDTPALHAIAELATARARELDAAGSLELFSYYALDHPARIPNRFRWLRSRAAAAAVPKRIILGSASVADGLIPEGEYLDWLGGLETPASYFPHRRETASQLLRVAAIPGLAVEERGLPIELVLAGAREVTVTSLPSSAVETLRIILLGTGSSVEIVPRLVAA